MNTRQTGFWGWIIRILVWLLILGLFFTTLTWFAGAQAKSELANENPPPGQLVDVGGYRLHINCMGQGSPTVIMEAGNNDFSVQWSLVQPEIAKSTRVCIYDRAGFGWSDASPYPRTLETTVKELHTLLVSAKVEAPYVMVGHSFGGILVRAFAYQFPDQIAGIVLVDSAHQEQVGRVPALQNAATQVIGQFRTLSVMQSFGLLALSPEQIPVRGLQGVALQQYRAILATTNYFTVAANETEAIFADWGNIPSDDEASLKDIPLIVLSRGLPEPLPGVSVVENQQYEQEWQEMQKELVALSSESRQIIAKESGHYIQLQQPDLVIDAVEQIVESAE